MNAACLEQMTARRFRQWLIGSVAVCCMSGYGLGQSATAAIRPAPEERSQIRTEGGSAITLDPPTGWDLQVHAFDAQGNALPEAPANFRRLGEVKAGEVGDVHTLTLRFSETVTLTHIQSTRDFRIEQGGSCVEGGVYAANTTCTLPVRFTPQGPGNRLGHLVITHSGSSSQVQPAAFGLGGYGYSPVINFIPSVITTLPGSYPSSVGLLSGAHNLTVDGSDTLWIADTGNGLIRYLNSSGNLPPSLPDTRVRWESPWIHSARPISIRPPPITCTKSTTTARSFSSAEQALQVVRLQRRATSAPKH